MYAGFIVEYAPVRDIYKQTSHPYTLGLLQSLPTVTSREKRRLIPIEGLPPDLLREADHCPFAPRCRFVTDRCWQENPPLRSIGPGHASACWHMEEVRMGALTGAGIGGAV
jgi:oligopeptide transport system ATP-binding protein